MRRVLAGEETGPPADIVRLNAGCALWVAERTASVAEGVTLATEVLRSGAGLARLEALVTRTQELAP